MSGYLDDELFKEPEYRDVYDMVVATYIIANRDMAGVCPFYLPLVAKACRISTGKIKSVIAYFESIDKLQIGGKQGENFTHIWWKSGIFHSLFKGKYSETQWKAVTNSLKKWQNSQVFGQNFEQTVSQLYDTKYGIKIPYADYLNLNLNQSVIKSKGGLDKNPTEETENGKTKESPPTTEKPVPPPLDSNQKQEIDWLLKAVRLMARKSRTFEMDLMQNGDLDIKFTKWARESGGVRWIMFCAGIMWRRVEVYNDGLNDAFACAQPTAIESPMAYLHSLVFPEKNGHQPTFMAGEVAYREEKDTEFWFRVFFKKLSEAS